MRFSGRVGRCRWTGLALCALLAGGSVCLAGGPDSPSEPSPARGLTVEEVTPAAKVAIRRGLDFLASRQDPSGAWVEYIGYKVNEDYQAHRGKHVGATALSCLAFLSNGSTPGRGPYGANLERGLGFILRQVRPDDGFITADGSRMYSHAFATTLLGEVYGMTGRPELKPKLELAVRCLVASQNRQGGWRYRPFAPDADISITVTAVQALRAARNAGVHVPAKTIDRAISYVKRSQVRFHPSPRIRGGFWYQIDERPFPISRTSFALTAAGVTALYGAGAYDSSEEIRMGLSFLRRPENRPPVYRMRRSFDYFYSHYYAAQAFFQAGGDLWGRWYPSVRDELLAGVNDKGHWEDLVGPIYATAMAEIILQIPYRYLPIFER